MFIILQSKRLLELLALPFANEQLEHTTNFRGDFRGHFRGHFRGGAFCQRVDRQADQAGTALIVGFNTGGGEPLARIAFSILGTPVERPSVSSSSFKNSPIRRFR